MNNLTTILSFPQLRLLVVSACSSKKAIGNLGKAHQLTADDLDDPTRRKAGEARLAMYRKPAAEMYKGNGHIFVRGAIQTLRENDYLVSHYILSAGYGFLCESDEIVPYDVTFKDHSRSWIRARGQYLLLRKRLTEIGARYDILILILGREYFEAIGLPLPAEQLPRTFAYVAPSLIGYLGHQINLIRTGTTERRELKVYSSWVKERQFQFDVECFLKRT